MPTGYTAELMEKGMSFKNFVMRCARAMGATITMRDDPMDKEIPEMFEPSDYYIEQIKELKNKLAMLEGLSNKERIAFGEGEKERIISQFFRVLRDYETQNDRLINMEKQVVDWIPPTPDHQGFKDFMLNQIQISKHDLKDIHEEIIQAQNKIPLNYYQDAMIEVMRNIALYTKENAKEIERTEGRNKWLRELRESLRGLNCR